MANYQTLLSPHTLVPCPGVDPQPSRVWLLAAAAAAHTAGVATEESLVEVFSERDREAFSTW